MSEKMSFGNSVTQKSSEKQPLIKYQGDLKDIKSNIGLSIEAEKQAILKEKIALEKRERDLKVREDRASDLDREHIIQSLKYLQIDDLLIKSSKDIFEKKQVSQDVALQFIRIYTTEKDAINKIVRDFSRLTPTSQKKVLDTLFGKNMSTPQYLDVLNSVTVSSGGKKYKVLDFILPRIEYIPAKKHFIGPQEGMIYGEEMPLLKKDIYSESSQKQVPRNVDMNQFFRE